MQTLLFRQCCSNWWPIHSVWCPRTPVLCIGY